MQFCTKYSVVWISWLLKELIGLVQCAHLKAYWWNCWFLGQYQLFGFVFLSACLLDNELSAWMGFNWLTLPTNTDLSRVKLNQLFFTKFIVELFSSNYKLWFYIRICPQECTAILPMLSRSTQLIIQHILFAGWIHIHIWY